MDGGEADDSAANIPTLAKFLFWVCGVGDDCWNRRREFAGHDGPCSHSQKLITSDHPYFGNMA
jgi:hypothetical protein